MEELPALQEGMLVYSVYRVRGRPSEIREHVIAAVGRKFFYVVGALKEKIAIDILLYRNVTYCQFSIQYYRTKQEILDEWEVTKLESDIRAYFAPYGQTHLSLAILRQIAALLELPA